MIPLQMCVTIIYAWLLTEQRLTFSPRDAAM